MLGYIVGFIVLSSNVYAGLEKITEKRTYTNDFMIDVPELREVRPLEMLWFSYRTDKCEQYNLSIDNEDELRQTGFRRCKDGSVSFVQPKATGVGGWEGKCGHTFAANSMYTMCKVAVDPEKYFRLTLGDITPGVRPGTLRSGLSKSFNINPEVCPTKPERWTYFVMGNASSYRAKIKELLVPNYSHPNLQRISRDAKSYLRNPVGALIQNPGGRYIHWIKIIDVVERQNTCHFVVNHWDNQYEVPCDVISLWSGRVGRSYPIILKSYSLVSFR